MGESKLDYVLKELERISEPLDGSVPDPPALPRQAAPKPKPGVYVCPTETLKLLWDIKALWDEAGLGDDDSVSEPLYRRLTAAIAQVAEETPADRFGEFRVCWLSEDTRILTDGEGQGWDEATATLHCSEIAASTENSVWIEHQDPETKQWKQW